MSEKTTLNPLKALAHKLRGNPRYMAYVLDTYRQQETLSHEELAETLGTLPELVVRLEICLRPDADSPGFAEQVSELADFSLTDETQLAGILRQVDSLKKLATLPTTVAEVEARADTLSGLGLPGLLAAARDREDDADVEPRRDAPPAAELSAADEVPSEND
jgi:hypothetical protein